MFAFQTNQNIQQFLGLYNILCVSSAACRAATIAVNADTTCDTDDATVLCAGTCSGLADTFFNACPSNVRLYNTYVYTYIHTYIHTYIYIYIYINYYVAVLYIHACSGAPIIKRIFNCQYSVYRLLKQFYWPILITDSITKLLLKVYKVTLWLSWNMFNHILLKYSLFFQWNWG